MQHIYIIVENGEAYQEAYETYTMAVTAVKIKNKEILEWQQKESEEQEFPSPYEDIDVKENSSGTTHLYIEKGINIYIHRLPIVNTK